MINNFYFSDLFTLYYKGTAALRQSITAPTSPPICNQRWGIFSEFFEFLYSNGNYQPPNPWMPDHPTAWENIKEDYDANSNTTGRSYNTRFMGFAEFWYTRLAHKYETGWYLWHNEIIEKDDISRFTNSLFQNGKTEIEWIEEQISTAVKSYFLDSIKDKLNI